ncbi:MAG: PQQ-dependent sugar dehydrogenase [Deltaproteobacteria bacterium]|nr:PQQ-dependent sugar dehydrogenase [Deltaproteobacteria bacterium]
MRTLAWALLILAACSDSKNAPKDSPPPNDTPPGDSPLVDAASCESAPLPACATPVSGTRITLRRILPDLPDAALLATSPKNDARLFVVERSGVIHVYENEIKRATPFLDVSNSIAAGGEQGLLGLAFHPSYSCNGLFFIYYTTNTANVIARCSVTADANVANPTCTPVLSIPDFAGNHNGGMIEFGSDGYLYIGTGDGGGGGDPNRNAQALNNGSPQGDTIALLGKMLRIDVNNKAPGKEYAIPPTNPYATGGGAPEIFAIGLRNPWRWSFDKATGDIWIGDVGQRGNEELNVVKAGELSGKNFGWSIYEANVCCSAAVLACEQPAGSHAACVNTGLTFPRDSRSAASGWISIIAGETYRGSCYPDIVGWHFYTDHNTQTAGLHKARLTATGFETVPVPITLPSGITSIHADARGEIYVTRVFNNMGALYHLEANP